MSAEALKEAQSSVAKARQSNKELDEEFRQRKMVDGPSFSFYGTHLPRSASPWAGDMSKLRANYLVMKEFLKENQCPIPGNKLLQEVPKTKLDLFEYKDDDPMNGYSFPIIKDLMGPNGVTL